MLDRQLGVLWPQLINLHPAVTSCSPTLKQRHYLSAYLTEQLGNTQLWCSSALPYSGSELIGIVNTIEYDKKQTKKTNQTIHGKFCLFYYLH